MTTTTYTWPDTLPLEPDADGYEEVYPDEVIRSPVDDGPAKQRPGSTRLTERMNVTFSLDDAQKIAFKNFLRTIGRGACPFHYVHPSEGTLIVVQIVSQVSGPKRISANNWQVSFSLEIVPS